MIRGCWRRGRGPGLLEGLEQAGGVGLGRGFGLLGCQEGFDAFQEAVHAEGFVEVVVYAHGAGVGLVAFAFVACDHDDVGGLAFLLAGLELFEDEEAAALGEHDVEDDQVRFGSVGLFEAGVAVAGGVERRAGFGEGELHGREDFLVVIDHQDRLSFEFGGHGFFSLGLRPGPPLFV